MNIYVASSWRNKYQPLVVETLRNFGHVVYDFRNPPHGMGGFSWSEIDLKWETWTPAEWIKALEHPLSVKGYASDFNAMCQADVCVLVLPSGRSSHLEAGWFCGQGKPVICYVPESVEPDLMVRMFTKIVTNIVDLVNFLKDI